MYTEGLEVQELSYLPLLQLKRRLEREKKERKALTSQQISRRERVQVGGEEKTERPGEVIEE